MKNNDEESITTDNLLAQEREGLQIAKFFLDYCFRASDMLSISMVCLAEIVEKLREYAFKMCDDCGGAMCSDNCPVSMYIDDMSKWLKGERTIFAIDRTNLRNCDVGSPTEQSKRFEEFCKQRKELKLSSYQCKDDCPCLKTLSDTDCEFVWSQMPYESTEEQNDSKRT